jgi:DNA-binding transcriptional LysR family regulator
MENLTDIAVFVRVVETGSFTKTAEQLQLSRAAVSKYVTRLEERLGARLINPHDSALEPHRGRRGAL